MRKRQWFSDDTTDNLNFLLSRQPSSFKLLFIVGVGNEEILVGKLRKGKFSLQAKGD